MARFSDVVIVGAGHGGAQAAAELRNVGFDGSIRMIGEEWELPYERPPLSKDYLSGKRRFDRMLLRSPEFWAQRGIQLALGQRVVSLNADLREVTCNDGDVYLYGKLIWAAGGRPRRLQCSGHDLQGIHTLRNRADVDCIASELASASRVVVVGGGYIGLEAAAVLINLGKTVTVVETLGRLLARVAGAGLSEVFRTRHRVEGVAIHLGSAVHTFEGYQGHVAGVRLDNGDLLPADMVIIGIGIAPNVGPLIAAGAKGENGVDVDPFCATTLPDVHAIGDCAARVNRFAQGQRVRLESVQNANEQATIAARAIAGAAQTCDAVPWFWSNQYDLCLRTVGLSSGFEKAIVRGSLNDKTFSVVYVRDGTIIALDCVNNTKDYVQGRELIRSGRPVDITVLADPAVPLRSLLNS